MKNTYFLSHKALIDNSTDLFFLKLSLNFLNKLSLRLKLIVTH